MTQKRQLLSSSDGKQIVLRYRFEPQEATVGIGDQLIAVNGDKLGRNVAIHARFIRQRAESCIAA